MQSIARHGRRALNKEAKASLDRMNASVILYCQATTIVLKIESNRDDTINILFHCITVARKSALQR